MTLPKSLQIDNLMKQPLPEDMTLAEARGFWLNDEAGKQLQSMMKRGLVRMRFVLATTPERELPDEMTLCEFRKLAAIGRAFISIDDEGGGGGRMVLTPKVLT